MIEVRNIRKSYGKLLAVNDVSFEVEEGESFAFLGPNGAGKTTTIKIVMGFLYPEAGYVKVFGKDVFNNGKKIRNKIGYLPEEFGFYENLSAYDNLDIFARLFDIPKSERERKIEEVLELVGLSERKNSPVKEYSHGMKQRLGIAQSLINDPSLLIYDEPTSGLDPKSSYEVRKIIKSLIKEGKTLFLSSHLLHEVQQVCDTVAIINKGEIVVKDKIKNLSKMLSEGGIKVNIKCLNLNEKIIEKVKKLIGDKCLSVDGNLLTAFVKDEDQISVLVSSIVNAGGKIVRVEEKTPDLEEIFLKLTGG